MCNVIFEKFPDADALAGVATAGIAWGAMAADQLKLPFLYVRPKPKEHGMGNQIEGAYEAGQKVVVIEDLISTGKSSLQVVDVLRSAGVEVAGMVSIFNYGFELATRNFYEADVSLISLSDYSHLISHAQQKKYISDDDVTSLKAWRVDPANWKK